jgi:hypothetical protein
MSALAISLIALAVLLAGASVGVGLRRTLPEHHMTEDTKDLVRLGTGLIGTMAALVLGLLIAAANSSFGTQTGHIQHMAADIILLDQLLVQYGPEAKPAREGLRETVTPLVERIWAENRSDAVHPSTFEAIKAGQDTGALILHLAPQNEAQRALKDRAIQVASDLAQTRYLLFEQSGGAIPPPFLIVLIFWLAIIFMSFGLFCRINLISGAAIVVFAVSAAGALFLVLELSDPFTGLMQISSSPLRNALSPL